MSLDGEGGFAGDISVDDAYALLAREGDAVLVDVRSQPEWQFVGAPDLSALAKSVMFHSWQVYPAMQIAPDFVSGLEADLQSRGAKATSALLFLCRSGARSRSAAIAMTQAGWSRCYNIADGFEGPLDDRKRRGVTGWKARGLPWRQT
jgi:rhodanese-related sulfurtransferase